MPAKIVVVSPKPLAVNDLGSESEIEPEWIVNLDSTDKHLPDGASGLLISGPSENSHERDVGTLVGEAVDADIPILAFDSGMHLLNAALRGDAPRTTTAHSGGADGDVVRQSMFLAPGAKVSSTIGGSGWLTIPCCHQTGVLQAGLAPDVMVSAIAADRVVEAFEMPGRRWVIGVQWDVLSAIKMPRGFDSILMAFMERATGK